MDVRLGALCVAGLLLGSIVGAAAQAVPVPRTKPDPMYLNEVRSEYQVFVIGDSLAAGLWEALDRLSQDDSRFVLNARTKEGTGFTRPDIYDWPQAINGILERNEVHIAVIMLGTNDSQDMRVNGETVSFGSERWIAAYNEALESFITALMERNVAVYWVNMPPMLSHDHDRAMTLVNELQGKNVEAAGIRLIDAHSLFAGPDGGYSERGYDKDGIYGPLRDRDGIHILKRGNDKLASLVQEDIRRSIESADRSVAVRAGGDEVEVTELPAFGQEAGGGKAIMVKPVTSTGDNGISVLPDAVSILPGSGQAGSARSFSPLESAQPDEDEPATLQTQIDVLRQSAARGSIADDLFRRGQLPESKPGRADDFAWSGDR